MFKRIPVLTIFAILAVAMGASWAQKATAPTLTPAEIMKFIADTGALLRIDTCPGVVRNWVWISHDGSTLIEPLEGVRFSKQLHEAAAKAGLVTQVVTLNRHCPEPLTRI